MLSQSQEDRLSDARERLDQLKGHFRDWAQLPWRRSHTDLPAVADVLKQLDAWYNDSKSKADIELDNPTRALALLQSANAYDKVRAYIRRHLSE